VRGIAARLLRGFVGGSAARIAPAGAPGLAAWSASGARAPGAFDAWVRADGEEAVRVNPAGTRAIVGGLDGTRLAYTELRHGASSIRVVDTATGDRVALPAGVNTGRSEWAPSLSGDRLLFGRVRRRSSEERVLLADLAAGGVRVLAHAKGDAYVQPGKVAGDFAVWVRCRDGRRCRVVRRNLATGATVEIPNPGRRAQFAPSLTAGGTVYFAEASRLLCGRRLGLWRYAAGVRTLLARLPRGTDVARTDAGGGVLRYDRYDCAAGTARIGSLAG
jgi:hypothetical protein